MANFRPIKDEKEVISLRIPRSLVQEIDEKSALFEISRNEFLVQSIRFALDNMDEKTDKK